MITMKKLEAQQQQHHHYCRRLITKLALFVSSKKLFVLITLFFTLGFFTAYSITRCSPRPEINKLAVSSTNYSDLLRFRTTCADPIPAELVRQTLLNRLYNGSSPFVNFPPPHAARLLRAKRIKGWGSTGAVFENLIRRVRPNTIIEVGSFLGASAAHMATVAAAAGLSPQIICIDDFRGWPGFRDDKFRDIRLINSDVLLLYQFMQNMVTKNLSETIVPVPYSTSSALGKLCDWGVYADLVEVDAGHDFHSAWSDINMAHALLRPGGVIFGHDYFTRADDRGVRRAVNLFAKVKGLSVHVDGQHWVLV